MTKLVKKPQASFVATSVSSYVSFLEQSFEDIDEVLFRGQREDLPLLPKLARLKLRPGIHLLRTEREMLSEFKRQALSFIELTPENDWDWLSLAQHYGMATRLLDWTTNPLAALWFAIDKPAKTNKSAVVWTFTPDRNDYVKDPSKENPFSGERTKVFRPRHIARRITAQSGWFTVHKYISDDKKFIPMNRIAQYSDRVKKITVPPDNFSKIRYQLDRCGYNAASMLTDIAGLCRHIEWVHSLLKDENE